VTQANQPSKFFKGNRLHVTLHIFSLTSYSNTDMCKFESSQSADSSTQSADPRKLTENL